MIIKNYKQLAKTKSRKIALRIAEAGLKAIKTNTVMKNKVKVKNNFLFVGNKKFNLKKFKRIFVIGAGKASCLMAGHIEHLLKDKITKGIIIDITKRKSKRIEVIKGSHPIPSKTNINAAKKISKLVSRLNKNDLVICLISGGGSALLSYPIIPVDKLKKLNNDLLKSGARINEVNIVRKHISNIKGGNLAKTIYPAKLVTLIFSDVVGNKLDIIASGPTVYDSSTINNANKIIKKYKLNKIKLKETPKDKKYFRQVDNILLLTNKTAVDAMYNEAQKLKLNPRIYSLSVTGEARKVGSKILSKVKGNVLLAAGETTVKVTGKGKGGRNQELALSVINKMKNKVLISIGSDGKDNSDVAGAIVDKLSYEKSKKLNYKEYLKNNDSYNFFKKINDQIKTGPTGSNVADLFVVINIS